MAVVVNNSPDDETASSGGILNIFLVLVIVAAVIYFLVAYALPSTRQAPAPTGTGGDTIQQNQAPPPATKDTNPQINVPDKINVNVNPTK